MHKKVQLALVIVLLVMALLFEIDMRLNGWRQFAQSSPYYHTWLYPMLYIHLVCAVTTTALWLYTFIAALRRFGGSPQPNDYSPQHKHLARIAAADMVCTAVTRLDVLLHGVCRVRRSIPAKGL